MSTSSISRHFIVDCPSVPGSGSFNFQNLLQGRVDNACRVVTACMFISHGMRQDTALSLVLAHPACENQGTGAGGGRLQAARPRNEGSKPQHKGGAAITAPVAASRTVTVTWVGSELVGVWPDEKSIATRLQRALCHHFHTKCAVPGEKQSMVVPPTGVKGVTVHADLPPVPTKEDNNGFVGAVKRAAASAGPSPAILLLDENGSPQSAFDASAAAWAAGHKNCASGCSGGEAPSGFVFAIGGPDGFSAATTATVSAMQGAYTLRLPGPSLHAGVVVSVTHHVLDAAVDAAGATVNTAPAGAVAAAVARTVGQKGASTELGARSQSDDPLAKKRRIEIGSDDEEEEEEMNKNKTAAERIEALYRRYRPDKLHKAAKQLKEWTGEEASLLAQLVDKWGPE